MKRIGFLGLALFTLVLGGCGCNPPRQSFDVTITLHNDIQENVVVDIVAVGSELGDQEIGSWFRPVPGKRAAMKEGVDRMTLTFVPGGEKVQKLSKDDEIWKTWTATAVNKTAILIFTDLRAQNASDKPVRVSYLCEDWDKEPWSARQINVSIKSPLVVMDTLQKLPGK